MAKTNLYDMHENVASYFKMILELHSEMVKTLRERVDNKEITPLEFNEQVRVLTLSPAVLTVITAFLKTNNVVVEPSDLDDELQDFEKKVAEYKKTGVTISEVDPRAEVN